MQTIQFTSPLALSNGRLPSPITQGNQQAAAQNTRSLGAGGTNLAMGMNSFAVVGRVPAAYRPYFPQIKFGFACGICPICVGSIAFAHQVEHIKSLSHKVDEQDVHIKSGQGALEIRKAGAQTGGDVGTKYIGNEDGTRAQRLATQDYPAFLMASLPRAYETPDSESYKVIGRIQHASKGLENGLYKALIRGLEQIKQTETFSSEATPSLQEKLLKGLGNQVRAFGLYHHVAEGPKVRATERTAPGLVGYVSAVQLRPRELFVPSVRELPGFETLGAAPGGLMNLMSMATLHGGYDSLYITVEPWQHELKSYIKTLEKDYQIPIQPLSQNISPVKHEQHHTGHDSPPPYSEKPQVGLMPVEYRDFLHEMDLSHETQVYRIPLDQMKSNYEAIPADEKDKGKRDTQLMESIKLPDPQKNLLDAKHQEALRSVPRFKDITVLQGKLVPGDYDALQNREIPPELKARQ